jgi:hypothetical protein
MPKKNQKYFIRYPDGTQEIVGKPYPIEGSKYNFFTHKNDFGNMMLSNVETGYACCALSTFEDGRCTLEFLETEIERVINTELNPDWMAEKEEKSQELVSKFQIIFRKPLQHFYNPMWGFDAIRFDERVAQPNEEESTFQAVERKFGSTGKELIENLLDFEKSYGRIIF